MMKRHSRTLGFLPLEALSEYLKKGGVLGAISDGGELAGYLLYGANHEYYRIAHLCVAEDFRGQNIARKLVDFLKENATTQKFIRLTCRRDFGAAGMWPKLGFVPLEEKPSRSSEQRFLTVWHLPLARDNQLDIFQGKVSDTVLDVAIDAQIFFNFCEPESDPAAYPAKALLDDSLADSVKLLVTDELLVEINRQDDVRRRERSRARALAFPRVESDPDVCEDFESRLNHVLPDRTQSQQSDIRHLARTAASDVEIFLTQDQALLEKAGEISQITGLQVLSPTEFIIRVHELSDWRSYVPEQISGSILWKRITHEALRDIQLNPFLDTGERKWPFRVELERLLSRPNQYEAALLHSGEAIRAIWVFDVCGSMLQVHIARQVRPGSHPLFEMFLVSEALRVAAKRKLEMIVFKASAVAGSLLPHLFRAGFRKIGDDYVRFSFLRISSREQVLSDIAALRPECSGLAEKMPDTELEQYCSPFSLEDVGQRCFLIPIKPGYAMSLFDREQAKSDLFGGASDVLLRWENAYYRAKTHHIMLRTPARLLWYVSGSEKKIVAVSRLDQVKVGPPKELFREFKKLGILEWREISELCNGDISTEIMAMKFSHTFALPNPISLALVKSIFKKHDRGLSLQSPLDVPFGIYRDLLQQGFAERV